MPKNFFRSTSTVLAVALACAWAQPAAAQTWPDKTVTLVVGFPPGGALDTIGRALAEEMAHDSPAACLRAACWLGSFCAACQRSTLQPLGR